MKIALETKLRHMEKNDRRAIHKMFEDARKENQGKLFYDAGVDSEDSLFSAFIAAGCMILTILLIIGILVSKVVAQ